MLIRNRSRINIIVLLVVTAISLCGCWDSQDINKKNIVLLMSVDYKDGMYEFAGELAAINTSGSISSDKPSENMISYFSSKGKTLVEAREQLDREMEQTFFVAANRVVLFSEGLAKKGLSEYVSRLLSDIGYRQRVNLIITTTPIKELLKIKPRNSQSLGFAIDEIMNAIQRRHMSINTDLGHTTEHLASKNDSFLLPQFDKVEDTIALTGYSVQKNSKKVGLIKAEDSKGLILLLAEQPAPFYDINANGYKYVVRSRFVTKKIKPVYRNGLIEFDVKMVMKGEIQYSTDMKEKISDFDTVKIEDSLTEAIKNDLEMAVKQAQVTYKADYLHFYDKFEAKYAEKFRAIDNWNDVFSKAKVNINVAVIDVAPPPPIYY